MRYSEESWVAAESLWAKNSGAEVSRLTGIKYGALMQHAYRKGWPMKPQRIRPDRLARLRKAYEDSGIPLRTLGKRFRVHHSRIAQLAKSCGWRKRSGSVRP